MCVFCFFDELPVYFRSFKIFFLSYLKICCTFNVKFSVIYSVYVCGYAEGLTVTVALSHTLMSSGELEKSERNSSNVYRYFETLESFYKKFCPWLSCLSGL